MLVLYREWTGLKPQHEVDRAYHMSHARGGCRRWVCIELPPHLQQDIPSFPIWLKAHVKAQLAMGVRVHDIM